ncbi:MAG: hypothetical protein GY754_34525 [bacterium]|nr:hypothetical protein [bacterium]
MSNKNNREAFFLSSGMINPFGTLLYDCFNFLLILLYFVIYFTVGMLLLLFDNIFDTHLRDGLIRFYDIFS